MTPGLCQVNKNQPEQLLIGNIVPTDPTEGGDFLTDAPSPVCPPKGLSWALTAAV